jgi:small nuclear ribonucleoprotein (snRNP)-like protein|tara:strand:+ start:1103 stop:1354 length:252 start_codon:yes stop_codon:yes gene_type:complete
MNLHVIELVNNKVVVADVEELDEEPSCFLKNCREIIDIDGTITFRKWPLYTDETDTLIYSNRIVSISTPSDEVSNLYKKSINS